MESIRADEISKIIRHQIENFETGVEVTEVGTVIDVGDGIAQIYGLDRVMAGELLDLPHNVSGIALNLEEDKVGAVLFGDYRQDQRGRQGEAHGPHHVGPGRRGADRPRRRPARLAARRRRADRHRRLHGDRADRARRRRPPAGERARPDRPQGHRRDGADRARPARADHRRPPDRQDRGRARHDHQLEGQGPHLHLRRDRPEAVDGRAGREDAARETARWSTRSSSRRRPRSRPRCSTSRRTPGCAMGEYFRDKRQARAVRLRRSLQARVGVPLDLAAAAPAARPRGVPGRRLLPPLAPARARREAVGRERAAGR